MQIDLLADEMTEVVDVVVGASDNWREKTAAVGRQSV